MELANESGGERLSPTPAPVAEQAAASQTERQKVEPFGFMRLPVGVIVVYRRKDGCEQVYASPATTLRARRTYAGVLNG
jgi:hypothetical protein